MPEIERVKPISNAASARRGPEEKQCITQV